MELKTAASTRAKMTLVTFAVLVAPAVTAKPKPAQGPRPAAPSGAAPRLEAAPTFRKQGGAPASETPPDAAAKGAQLAPAAPSSRGPATKQGIGADADQPPKRPRRVAPLAPTIVPEEATKIPGVRKLAQLLAWQSGRVTEVLAVSRSLVLTKVTWRFAGASQGAQVAWLTPGGGYVTFAPIPLNTAIKHLRRQRELVRCLSQQQVRVLLPGAGGASERQRQLLGPWIKALGIVCEGSMRCAESVTTQPVWLGGGTRHEGVLPIETVAQRWGCAP